MDPNSGRSERRGIDGGWTDLPAKPSNSRVPRFPLGNPQGGPKGPENTLWKALWKRPQAEMWRRNGQEWQVAAYTRAFVESTRPDAPASLKATVLRMEDTLGLSTMGLTALRWRITVDELAKAREPSPSEQAERAAPVRRLRAAG